MVNGTALIAIEIISIVILSWVAGYRHGVERELKHERKVLKIAKNVLIENETLRSIVRCLYTCNESWSNCDSCYVHDGDYMPDEPQFTCKDVLDAMEKLGIETKKQELQ